MPDILDNIDITPEEAGVGSYGGGYSSGGGPSAYQIGQGAGVIGDLFSGIGGFMGSQAEASQLKLEEKQVQYFTAMQSMMQQRQAYQIQSKAEAETGAKGLAGGGSAEEILRMNAQNLALDNGIIRQQGGEKAGILGMQARAAETQGGESLATGILKGAAAAVMI